MRVLKPTSPNKNDGIYIINTNEYLFSEMLAGCSNNNIDMIYKYQHKESIFLIFFYKYEEDAGLRYSLRSILSEYYTKNHDNNIYLLWFTQENTNYYCVPSIGYFAFSMKFSFF